MLEAVGCPQCHRPVPADAPFDTCPSCLWLLALMDTPDGLREGTDVSVADASTVSGPEVPGPDTTLTQAPKTGDEKERPTVLGYRVVRELGEGGGGVVYLAHQERAGDRLVALKVLHGTSRAERERMKRETRSLGLLAHPNIVTVYDVGESDAGPYFTMEYLAAGSLTERIAKARPTPAEAVRIVEVLARAVHAAHEAGILHRDLKPSNVLIGNDGAPKVADFGLAKFEDTADDGGLKTPSTAVLGTAAYAPPEQVGGRIKEVDRRSDVYGLGAVLYHCLTGRAPFTGKNRVEIIDKVLTEEAVPPRSVNRTVPRELEAICLKCLEKKQEDRYPTASALADDLSRFLRGEQPTVRPLTWPARKWRAVVRNRRAVGTIAAVVVVVAGSVAAGAMLRPRPESAPVPDPDAELVKIREELERGETVELIGAEGKPRWYRWLRGDTLFKESPFHDGALSFDAPAESRLELLPPGVLPNAYQITVRIRHDGQPLVPGSEVAYYFGRWEQSLAPGTALSHDLYVAYNDRAPTAADRLGAQKNLIRVHAETAYSAPNTQTAVTLGNLDDFLPSDGGRGPPRWRTLATRVTPEDVEQRYVDETGRQFVFKRGRHKAARIDELMDQCRAAQRLSLPGAGRTLWTPTGGLGVFAREASVSVGSFTVRRL